MKLIQRLQRDISRHRSKATVLGILFVAMLVFTVKAIVEWPSGGPQAVGAAVVLPAGVAGANNAATPSDRVDAQKDMRAHQQFWAKLQEVKPHAVEAASAFAFDASYYPQPAPDLTRRPATPAPENLEPPKPAAPMPVVEGESAKAVRIRELARSLVVKSTTVGNGTLQPLAVVNQQLLTVGQEILGFQIVAIRAREVVFTREGVPVIVKMSDEPRGQ